MFERGLNHSLVTLRDLIERRASTKPIPTPVKISTCTKPLLPSKTKKSQTASTAIVIVLSIIGKCGALQTFASGKK